MNKTEPLHDIKLQTTSTENKERIWKAIREKNQIAHKGTPIKVKHITQ
jgi:hypothetical protein